MAAKKAGKPLKKSKGTPKSGKARTASKPSLKGKPAAAGKKKTEKKAPAARSEKKLAPSKKGAPTKKPKNASRTEPEAQSAQGSEPRRGKPSAPAAKGKSGPRSAEKAPASKPPIPKTGARKSAPEKKGSKGPTPGAPSRSSRDSRVSAPPVREATRLVSLPLPTLAPVRRPSIEERAAAIETRLAAQSADFRKRYEDSLDMSWIYHDSALEGVVYTFEELRSALSGQTPPVTDSGLQPTYDDIRRQKEAIDFVRKNAAAKKKEPIGVDMIRQLYLILHPEEGDLKTVKYRKDIPQHRLYFHEYAPPDKVGYKVRQVADWLNDPETRKTRNGVRIAARAHYDLVRVYPFATDSGKVARLFMNLLLMRQGMPPAILHSTERQRYYEALKGSANVVLQMVQEAVENALSSVEKLLDEHETKKRAFVS